MTISTSPVDPKLLPIVTKKLAADEKLLWVGQPVPLIYPYRDVAVLSPIFSVIGAFAYFVYLTPKFGLDAVRIISQELFIFLPLLVPLILVIYIASYFHAVRTVYALTDQRAMLISPVLAGIGSRRIASYAVRDMGVIDCQALPVRGTIGNVYFEYQLVHEQFTRDTRAGNWNPVVDKVGFYAVRHACELAQQMSLLRIVLVRNSQNQ
jgi:hypothetical protein